MKQGNTILNTRAGLLGVRRWTPKSILVSPFVTDRSLAGSPRSHSYPDISFSSDFMNVGNAWFQRGSNPYPNCLVQADIIN
jgi:hypothetical protein